MAQFRRYWSALLPIALIVLLTAALAACGDDDDDDTSTPTGGASATGGDSTATDGASATAGGDVSGSVEVLGIWGDEELTNFEAMVAPWEEETGGSVDFTGDRGITAILNTRVEGDSPPDVAIPAEVGLFQQFAAEGLLQPLSECEGLEEMITDEYPQSFVDLGTVDGTLYGFFMKADTKATIFYDPSFFDEKGFEPVTGDSSFDDLIALSDEIRDEGTVPPWSMGQEAGGGSGFPGSDFIQQILLNEAGADTYDGIIDGSIPFTDDAMADAWQKFGQIGTTDGYVSQGGADAIIATAFGDAVFPPFEDPPEAAMNYLGAFAETSITEQFPEAVAETDYDFMTFPGGAATGGANIVYAFNMNDTICSFLKNIAGAEAQQIWVELGGFTSVNENVSLDSYPGPVARKAAEQLLNAPEFRFDLDDAIGGAVQAAVFTGVNAFLQNPDDLDSILQNIEAARE